MMVLLAEFEPAANPCIGFHGKPSVFSVQFRPSSSERQMPLSAAANMTSPRRVRSKWKPIIRPSGPLHKVHVVPPSRDSLHLPPLGPARRTFGSDGFIAISP